MHRVTSICRYPVKGMRPQKLMSVALKANCGVPLDRRFAIKHAAGSFDQQSQHWAPRKNFVVVKYSPPVAALSASYNSSARTITVSSALDSHVINIDSPNIGQQLSDVLSSFAGVQAGPYELVELERGSMTDSPDESISILNRQSLVDVENRTGVEIDPVRFRGNMWFDGTQPWQERQWVGKQLTIGGALFCVTEEIVRCAAIDVNPQTGEPDSRLLTQFGRTFGHTIFGVLAKVVEPGRVRVGDELAVNKQSDIDAFGI